MNEFANTIVSLPFELKAALAAAVLAVVRLFLQGRVPDDKASEIAAILSTALIALVELALGVIPPEFEAIAVNVLNLIVLLLGSVLVYRSYLFVRSSVREDKTLRKVM